MDGYITNGLYIAITRVKPLYTYPVWSTNQTHLSSSHYLFFPTEEILPNNWLSSLKGELALRGSLNMDTHRERDTTQDGAPGMADTSALPHVAWHLPPAHKRTIVSVICPATSSHEGAIPYKGAYHENG